MKFSHSSISTYTTCGYAYKLKYIDKWSSLYKSSPLFFGGSLDEALNHLLLNKDAPTVVEDTIKIFTEHWTRNVSKYGEVTEMQRNPYVLYSKYDFDGDLLQKSDWAELFKEVKVYNKKTKAKFETPFDIQATIQEKMKTQDFQDLDEADRAFYNFNMWFSLLRKGEILIKEYHRQLVPRIKEVIDVQRSFELEDEEKHILNGIIDFICILDDGTLVVADNKTSSLVYDDDSVKTSVQLSLYVKALNILNELTSDWKYGKIEKAAYFVMSKKLIKDKTKVCKSCGHVGEGSHKTCDNMIDDKRCGGEWEKNVTFSTDVQLIVDKIDETVQDMILENADHVKTLITQGVFMKNFNSCQGKFGPCEFQRKCWSNCDKNLKKREG